MATLQILINRMNKVVKNSFIYLCATVLTSFLGFVNSMLMTRWLTTSVYAQYGLFATFTSAVLMLSILGFDASFNRFFFSHNKTYGQYLKLCLKYPLIAFGVFALFLLEPKQIITKFIFGEDTIYALSIILVIYIAISIIQRFFMQTLRMEEKAFSYSLINLIGSSGFILIIVYFFYITHNVTFVKVALSFIITSAIALTINIVALKKILIKKGKGTEEINKDHMWKYGYPIMINNSLALIIPLIERLIIRDISGWEMLSLYTSAMIFSTIISIMSLTVNNIWEPIVYKYFNNEQLFKPILHTVGMSVSLLSCLGLAILILTRRWLVLLIGEDYHSVYIIIPCIMYASSFNIVSNIYAVGINIKKKTSHYVIIPLLQILISFTTCYLLIPRIGLTGVGYSMLVSLFVSRLYRIILGLHYYNTGTNELTSFILWFVCISFSVLSMHFTSMTADFVMFVTLFISVICLLNRKLIVFYKDLVNIIKIK